MNNTYSNAPLSEVICGITLNQPVLGQNGFVFGLINALKDDYPVIGYGNPLEDLEMKENTLEPKIDYKLTGPMLYRLATKDTNWLVQLQFNKIFLNWIKKDEEKNNTYPGFTGVYKKFAQLVTFVQQNLHAELPIKFCELTFQDRVFWQEYIDDLSCLDKIMHIGLPAIKDADTTYPPNNMFSKYIIPFNKIGGYSIISVNTATASDNKQIINFHCTLRGAVKDMLIDEWYKIAHEIQLKIFHDSFNEKYLESIK